MPDKVEIPANIIRTQPAKTRYQQSPRSTTDALTRKIPHEATFGTPTSYNSTIGSKVSWTTMILPFMEQANLYNLISTSMFNANGATGWLAIADVTPKAAATIQAETMIPGLVCPSDPSGNRNSDRPSTTQGYYWGKSNYPGVRASVYWNTTPSTPTATTVKTSFGNSTVKVKFRDMIDGSSNIIMVGERTTQDSPAPNAVTRTAAIWIGIQGTDENAVLGTASSAETTTPAASTNELINRSSPNAFSSPHVGGCHFLMGDGKVRFISENINGDTYTWLAGISDGHVIGEF